MLRTLKTTIDDELFDLPFQSAQDVRRYDFVRDVGRLERLRQENVADDGFAVALTNDPSYWQPNVREGTTDASFRLPEGRRLAGVLNWAAHTGAGTMRDRTFPIPLGGDYLVTWRDYGKIAAERYGHFRYLAVEVLPES